MTDAPARLPAFDLRPADVAFGGFLPLGSWRLNVFASRPAYLETLGALVRQDIPSRPARPPHDVDAELFLVERAADAPDFTAGGPLRDGSIARWEHPRPGLRELRTGRMRISVLEDRAPAQIRVLVREPQISPRGFRDHLFELLTKLLFSFDRFYVHAAAVELNSKVSVFVGTGAAGKTTTSLWLARAGATILSEDHVLFTRRAGTYLVSGCQETLRLTPRTEQALFPAGLDAPVHPGDGKKELPAARLVRSVPYRDFPYHRVFFNHLGDRFQIRPISLGEATTRLLYMTRGFFRASDPAELERYLAAVAALAEGRETFDLQLAPELERLQALTELLRA